MDNDVTPHMAGHIAIERNRVTIDGQPFPWYIAGGSIFVDVDHTDIPSVTLKILADRVTVDNDFRSPRR